MRTPESFEIARRALRFPGPLTPMLSGMAKTGPLYVHSRNWMAEMASIVPLAGMVEDESENSVFFPEDGLHLALDAVEAVHGVEIDCRGKRALALEIATLGEPRSLSIVAIPHVSDVARFSVCLNRHPAQVLDEEEYQQWREDFLVRPVICPCCQAAADERRAYPERNPLTRVFCDAIDRDIELRCTLVSPVFGFSTWLKPGHLQFTNGILGVIAEDGQSMLEIDPGVCHTLRIVCRQIDDEPFSEIHLYDSVGTLHFKISARGWDKEAVWRGFCKAGE